MRGTPGEKGDRGDVGPQGYPGNVGQAGAPVSFRNIYFIYKREFFKIGS